MESGESKEHLGTISHHAKGIRDFVMYVNPFPKSALTNDGAVKMGLLFRKGKNGAKFSHDFYIFLYI